MGPGVYDLPERGLRLEVTVGPEPPEEPGWPLWLRTRRPGDRFRPERGRGEKKLKSWLIDRKVPVEERDGLVVLADGAGRVLWLPELGVRARSPGLRLRVLPPEPSGATSFPAAGGRGCYKLSKSAALPRGGTKG
jgi:tRNA(Ile)-lysidine synthase